ncbi:cation:dicarboxylate symporter family transporter [Candidatus Bandiella euplotis]|uniref:Cation:dicarboxylase symporter family transporter n=1 Tax=Candidatus Bandiella euplotis TaxID=1664265 RepID=A0ABZ0ULJ1_9RICK|nr:cation:dicarboxylase symporter family transporter [Candidatus Bandiella woodruffii]WPX97015.1 Cation:dicarboxylase symporter family transporter [Candidatus Bandiella woodruffii]
MKLIKKIPITLILSLFFAILFSQYIPADIKSFLYAVSLSIQGALMLIVPFIIVIFIFRAIVLVEGRAFKFIAFFACLIYASNFIASFISFNLSFYSQSEGGLSNIDGIVLNDTLKPLWKLNIEQIISNRTALFIGVLLGILAPYILRRKEKEISEKIFAVVMKFINTVFVPIIPVFIIGFLLKLQQDNIFELIVANHFNVIKNALYIGVVYILLAYLVSNKLNLKAFGKSVYNMMPAALTACISMSSTAALPYTIRAVEKNTKSNSKLATSLVPSVTNMHLLGDCFLIPACIFIVAKLFNHQIDYMDFAFFLTYFVLMKFTVITIPGGGVLTIMPILQSQLSFTPDMLSLITTIYFLLDPFLAFMNVLGNGALCLALSKLLGRKEV